MRESQNKSGRNRFSKQKTEPNDFKKRKMRVIYQPEVASSPVWSNAFFSSSLTSGGTLVW